MNIFYQTYKWVIAYPILVVVTILVAVTTMIGSVFDRGRWFGYYPPHIWAKLWCWLLFVKVEVRNRQLIDPKTSYVFIANHQGAYDIFTVYGFLGHNFKWMMKKSLEKIPFVGLACLCAGHIMVDRSSTKAVMQTLAVANKRLRNGMSLVVFPEGARTWDGKMRAFKKGAFKLASDFKLPLVPITIDGSFAVLPRTSTVGIKPGKIILTIHEPIPVDIKGTNLDAIMKQSFNSIQSALPENERVSLENLE